MNKYQFDSAGVIGFFSQAHVPVYFVSAPISRAQGAQGYVGNAPVGALFSKLPAIYPAGGLTRFIDGAAAVEWHGHYTDTLPCAPWETCTGHWPDGTRTVVVREADGVHFCPVKEVPAGGRVHHMSGVHGWRRTLRHGDRRTGAARVPPELNQPSLEERVKPGNADSRQRGGGEARRAGARNLDDVQRFQGFWGQEAALRSEAVLVVAGPAVVRHAQRRVDRQLVARPGDGDVEQPLFLGQPGSSVTSPSAMSDGNAPSTA